MSEGEIRFSGLLRENDGVERRCRSAAVLARKLHRGEIASVEILEDPEAVYDALQRYLRIAFEEWRAEYGRKPECTWEWEEVCEVALAHVEIQAPRCVV